MEPNFHGGQVVQFQEVASTGLRRGDVIVFRFPSSRVKTGECFRAFMKRIVALPGERIEIKNSTVFR